MESSIDLAERASHWCNKSKCSHSHSACTKTVHINGTNLVPKTEKRDPINGRQFVLIPSEKPGSP